MAKSIARGRRKLTFRDLRLAKYLTREELAVAADVTASTIGHIELGHRAAPQLKTLRRLADALGVEVPVAEAAIRESQGEFAERARRELEDQVNAPKLIREQKRMARVDRLEERRIARQRRDEALRQYNDEKEAQ